MIASGFNVANKDAFADAEIYPECSGSLLLGTARRRPGSAGVRSFIGFDTPFGNRLELVAQQESITRPMRFNRSAGIVEFGHLCVDAPDVHKAYWFWRTHFNAEVSDRSRTGSATGPA